MFATENHDCRMVAPCVLKRPPIFLKFRSSKWLICSTAFAATFTDGFLYSTMVPVLPFSLVDRSGVSEDHVQFWISILLVTFGVTMTLGSPIAGWFTDRSKSRQVPLLVGLALASMSTIIFYFARAPWLLVLARAFQGFSSSLIYTAGLALVADTVTADEIGYWMGFVLSGMNLGALITPWLAGAIYDRFGYYAVWIACLVVLAFDSFLRIVMVEKKSSKQWMVEEVDNSYIKVRSEETDPLLLHQISSESGEALESGNSSSISGSIYSTQASLMTSESSSMLTHEPRLHESWFRVHFPVLTILLSSSRIRAAVYGCFTQMTLITAFDAILPLFTKRTFSYSSSGAGLIFLALTIPSGLGTVIGALSDRYGTRAVSSLGFVLTIPSLAVMGVVTNNSVGYQAALIIILVVIGTGLSFILTPLAADMFDEAEHLAALHPDLLGGCGAYAQAYSLFNAALGLSTMVGPAWSGLFFEKTNWQITSGSLAVLCVVGALPVWAYTGKKEEQLE